MLFRSSHGTPNLAKVIPAIDHLDQHLTTSALDKKYDPAIQEAIAVGKNLLNKYYNMTDDSELYRITMGMYLTVNILNLLCFLNFCNSPSKSQTCIL